MIFRLRSLLFDLFFYTFTTVYLILFFPFAVLGSRKFILVLYRVWTRICFTMLSIIVGLRYTVRGREHLNAATENGACIIACKHQSAFDTIFISMFLDDIVIISKGQLASIPFFGYYLKKLGTVFIDRGNKTSAIRDLLHKSRDAIAKNRTLFIFPEGTRAKPGESIPYQRGISLLYRDLNVPVVPVALNTGVFWGRKSFFKRPGMIVIDIQPAIPAGLERDHFLEVLQKTIDTASANLLHKSPSKRKRSWFKKFFVFIFGLSIAAGLIGYFGTKALINYRLNSAGIYFATGKIHFGLHTLPAYELTNVTLNSPVISGSMVMAKSVRLILTGLNNFTLEAKNINMQLYGNMFVAITDLEAFINQTYKRPIASCMPFMHIPHILLQNTTIKVGSFTSTLNEIKGEYHHEGSNFTFSTPRPAPIDFPIILIKGYAALKDNAAKGKIEIQTTLGGAFINALQQQGMITNIKARELKAALKPIEHESNQNLKQITLPIGK